jgi:4-carboxymuconolactone decarboxylase
MSETDRALQLASRDAPNTASRITLLQSEQLDADQARVYAEVVSGPRGVVRGPVLLWLHSPELASRAQRLGEFLRWGTVLEPRLSELAILVTARHSTCHYIWFNHVKLALENGLDAEVVNAIRERGTPRFAREDEAAVYDFASEVLTTHRISDATLERVKRLFGERGAIELGSIIGHYQHGAITLATAELALPDGSRACLPE